MKYKKDMADLIDNAYIEEYQNYVLKHGYSDKKHYFFKYLLPIAGTVVAAALVIAVTHFDLINSIKSYKSVKPGEEVYMETEISYVNSIIDSFNELINQINSSKDITYVGMNSNKKIDLILDNDKLDMKIQDVSSNQKTKHIIFDVSKLSMADDTYTLSGIEPDTDITYWLKITDKSSEILIYVYTYTSISSYYDANEKYVFIVDGNIKIDYSENITLIPENNCEFDGNFIDYMTIKWVGNNKCQIVLNTENHRYVFDGNVNYGVLMYTSLEVQDNKLHSVSIKDYSTPGYIYLYENFIIVDDPGNTSVIPFVVWE